MYNFAIGKIVHFKDMYHSADAFSKNFSHLQQKQITKKRLLAETKLLLIAVYKNRDNRLYNFLKQNKMKNFKKFTLGILGATILSLGLYSCSNDDVASDVRTNNTIEKNTTSSYELEKAYITLDNKMYIHENGFYEKYVEGEYEYDFVISDIDYELLQENPNSYTIINNFDTSEVIEITNLVGNSNGTFSFDIQADGIYISDVNFSYEANFSSKYVTNSLLGLPVPGSPVWKFVEIIAPVVIEKILEDKPDPNLAACREAMNSLNCGNNTNPYMEYIGGNWFTKSSCNVGCR